MSSKKLFRLSSHCHFLFVQKYFLFLLFFLSGASNGALLDEVVYADSVYLIYSDQLTWEEAKEFAESEGGHLVVVSSPEENNFIKEVIEGLNFSGTAADGGGAKYVWLGGNDKAVEGQWEWVDGSEVELNSETIKYWGDGAGHGSGSEPDNFQNQDCLAIGLEGWPVFNPGFYGSKGQWNDIDCGNKLGFIVEIKITSVPDNLSGLSASDGIDPVSVILSWNASEGATSYEIYVATTLEGQREFITETSSTEAVIPWEVITGGAPGVIYYFFVFPVNSGGLGTGQWDTGYSGIVPGLPANLSGLSASDGIDPVSVILSWNASEGATSYEIYVATTLEGQREFITETSSTEADIPWEVITGGAPGVIYYFFVFPVNSVGQGIGQWDTGFNGEPEPKPDVVPDIPQQTLSGIIRTDGSATESSISVGASSDGGETSNTTFSVDDEIVLTAKAYPDPADVGEEGELYVVLRTIVDGSKAFVALNEDGLWVSWNASLKTLPAAKYVETLSEVEEVLIYSGQMVVGQRLMYVGYSLFTEDGVKPVITANGKPFGFEVQE